MNYAIYKLKFTAPVHFGKSMLTDSEFALCSDTIFAALCMEAVQIGDDLLNELVSCAKANAIQLSDVFPYIGDKILLPKPHVFVEHSQDENSSIIKKAYKKLKYITIDDFDSFLNGSFDVLNAAQMSELGVSALKVSASIRNDEGETKPYEVGTYSFYNGCGLYLILGYSNDNVKSLLDTLMDQLQHSGLGGKRSSGYGRFNFEVLEVNEWLLEKLNCESKKYMLLNTALPTENELEEVIKNANYSLIKRSGFVASSTYSDTWQRKKDLIMFKSGSCFDRRFDGDVYDVSDSTGNHPIFRFGKPMFMRIS